MYRSDSALASDPSALVLTAQALLARNDAPSRALLETARDSAETSAALREQLISLLLPPPAAGPEPVAEVAAAPEAAPPPPIELRTLLDAARPQLAPCVDAAQARSPKLTTVRVWFVALPDGSVRDVHVTPIDKQLASCLSAKLAELRLPCDHKQLVSYQLGVPPTAAGETPAVAGGASDAFWARAERRASKTTRTPQSPPWWLDRNPLFVVMDEATGARAAEQPAESSLPGHNPPAAGAAATVTEAPPQPPAKPSGARAGSAQSQPAPQPSAASASKPGPGTPAAPTSEDTWWVPAQDGKH
jgi:hypothetical protein